MGRAALTGKHDLRIHLTRLSTEGLGPRHGEVRRAHQMLNAAMPMGLGECLACNELSEFVSN